MSELLTAPLDATGGEAYNGDVKAFTPETPDGEQARGLHTKRRRRPAVGAEAYRRRWFGRTFGEANRAAGQQVREARKQ